MSQNQRSSRWAFIEYVITKGEISNVDRCNSTQRADGLEIWIIPVVNPDGFAFCELDSRCDTSEHIVRMDWTT